MSFPRLLTVAGAWILCAAQSFAHDFWIQPALFRCPARTRVEIDLRVGEGFVGKSVPRNPEKLERFFALDANGQELPLAGIDGKSPAAYFAAAAEGRQLVCYVGRASTIELEAGKFEDYLREEGLEHVIAERERRGERASVGREAYARCAKALIDVIAAPVPGTSGAADGPEAVAALAASALHAQSLGLALELVLDQDPCRSLPDARLGVRLLRHGKPLAGVLVGCMRSGAAELEQRARSDANGALGFEVEQAGTWLLRAVHMVRAQPGSGVEWESTWTSLTFELPPVSAAAPR